MVSLLWAEFTLWRCVFKFSILNSIQHNTCNSQARVHTFSNFNTYSLTHSHTYSFDWFSPYIQVIVLSWVYGIDRVFDNLSQMNMKFGGCLRAYWWTVWTLVTPIASFVSVFEVFIWYASYSPHASCHINDKPSLLTTPSPFHNGGLHK